MTRFIAPTSRVAHERVEDEVIAINLTTGTYFSLQDSAADTWSLLMQGADIEGASVALAELHGLDARDVAADVRAFVDRLVTAGLLVEDPDVPSMSAALASVTSVYIAPTLQSFDDMEELLLLDPIHEVDDAGWPVLPVQPQ